MSSPVQPYDPWDALRRERTPGRTDHPPDQPTYKFEPPAYDVPGPVGYSSDSSGHWPGQFGNRPRTRGNGSAVAGLVLSMLLIQPLGLIFSVIGVVRAKATGARRTTAAIGLVLSIIWLGVVGVALVTVLPQRVKSDDPGCTASDSSLRPILDRINTGHPDAVTLRTELPKVVAVLRDGAVRTKSEDARQASTALADDFQQLVDAINSGSSVSPDLDAKITADVGALGKACGWD